jgi:F-type H+-transporting ATPase subunit b
MDATLHALGGILLRAVPTFLLLVLLHFYMKFVFFKPMQKVLQKRFDATEGARKAAQESFERASAKTAEYEAAIRAARAEVYQAQEHAHKALQERHAASVKEARRGADQAVAEAKRQLAGDVEAAKATLARDAEALSNQIADAVLGRSAA